MHTNTNALIPNTGFYTVTHASGWLGDQTLSDEEQRLYARERCIVVATEAIAEQMQLAGMTRAAIAQRIGVSKGHISRVLNGSRNMTLNTLADLLWACGVEADGLEVSPLGVTQATGLPVLHVEAQLVNTWQAPLPEPSPTITYLPRTQPYADPVQVASAPTGSGQWEGPLFEGEPLAQGKAA